MYCLGFYSLPFSPLSIFISILVFSIHSFKIWLHNDTTGTITWLILYKNSSKNWIFISFCPTQIQSGKRKGQRKRRPQVKEHFQWKLSFFSEYFLSDIFASLFFSVWQFHDEMIKSIDFFKNAVTLNMTLLALTAMSLPSTQTSQTSLLEKLNWWFYI